MSEATNTKLMDTEPGGENTQYEGQATFVKPHATERGQFSDPSTNEANRQAAERKRDRGEQTAENSRYGEAISEHGFGGETWGNSGEADGGGSLGRVAADAGAEEGTPSRRAQGYGGGSGIGA